jgi:carbonic anhydrase
MKTSILVLISVLLSLNAYDFRLSKRDNEKARRISKPLGYLNSDKSLLPDNWHEAHPKCLGNRQSPINIESYKTVYDKDLSQIVISSAFQKTNDANEETWSIKNNGKSVDITPINKVFSFQKKPENEEYKLLHMHFHWRGSEHYVDGQSFAAELHLVHQNQRDAGKFAVLGFFLRQSNEDNQELKPIIDGLVNVLTYNKTADPFQINDLRLNRLLPKKLNAYYRYPGSLTVAPCDEFVEWFVMDNPVLTISEEQLLMFQSVEDPSGYPILTNSRPIQDIKLRKVFRSFGPTLQPLPKNNNFLSASGHTEPYSIKNDNQRNNPRNEAAVITELTSRLHRLTEIVSVIAPLRGVGTLHKMPYGILNVISASVSILLDHHELPRQDEVRRRDGKN